MQSSTQSSTPGDLYASGQLNAAITALGEGLRIKPADLDARAFLAELLCFAGNLDRADTQLETIQRMQPENNANLALFRQLVRAEKTRQEVLLLGRAPELLAAPTPFVQQALRAILLLRDGKAAEAAGLLEEAEAARPHPRGTCDGVAFDELRDLDDVTAGVLEVLTSTGKYFWVPLEHVRELRLDKPVRPRDLLWRPADLSVADGPDGKVFLPATYLPGAESDEATRLGRCTEWRGGGGSPVRGAGLRTWLVGEEARTILEVGSLAVAAATEA